MAPLITSHAACKGHAPENTLAGIRAALRYKADAIEIDLHCTRDGVPVLIHDATLDRTTDGEGEIADLSLRQVRKLNAAASPIPPTRRPSYSAPCAWQASSMTRRPGVRAIFRIGFISAGWP